MATSRLQHYYDAFRAPDARSSALATLRATNDTRSTRAAPDSDFCSVSGRLGPSRRDLLGQLRPAYGKQIRNAGFELLDTGHCPQEETPKRLTESGAAIRYGPACPGNVVTDTKRTSRLTR